MMGAGELKGIFLYQYFLSEDKILSTVTRAFCSRCIKCFLHLLFKSLMPTSAGSRAVTAWDVSAVSMKVDHSLINHGSSSTPFLTDTGLGCKLTREAPLSSRSQPCSQREVSACSNVSYHCKLGKQGSSPGCTALRMQQLQRHRVWTARSAAPPSLTAF